ncbi:unnamed protein product [Caenorhabditis bovis]|uniref:Uncharacterized protein n=1 Tax=Caenorhabditis bovis TaxID=2654633 RepID=A0A8S1ER13_9PELO|nr:unnamed protein product [Caenorhabditis bovis]
MNVQRFKEQLTKKMQNLGESLNLDDSDVKMDDMSEYVLSPYDDQGAGLDDNYQKPTQSQTSTPKKVQQSKSSEEDEIINSIDAAYFIDHDEFDAIDYELKKLPDVEMYYEDMSRERLRLKSQHSVVSKRISKLIMQKSPSYSGQIVAMESIHAELSRVITNVLNIRKSLSLAKNQTETCLGLIANEKKKRMLGSLKDQLLTIKMFYESEQRIREVMEAGNFPLAIQMLIETQILAANYKHFTCVNDVMAKLAGMSTLMENELSNALCEFALVYDEMKYDHVYTAFEMLDKSAVVPERLIEYFHDKIESSSKAIVLDKLKDGEEENTKNGLPYSVLCARLENEQVVIVFRELCFTIYQCFLSFHSILRYHSVDATNEKSQYVYDKLLESRRNLFLAATNQILYMIESRDFVYLKFDHILDIVDMINRIKNIGQKYFLQSCSSLITAIEKQISAYFVRYHRERMEELGMFVENESFAVCPVPPQFTIFDLQDFEFLKKMRHEQDMEDLNKEECVQNEILMSTDSPNPFSQSSIKSRHQSTYSTRSNESKQRSYSTNSEGIPTDNVDGSPRHDPLEDSAFHQYPTPSPNLCNTALNLLRFFGRYIRMTALLPSICDKSAPAIMELYEFFFASNIYPNLCPAVQIEFIDNLYGACERIIAIDSIEFVSRQLDLMRPVIESLISSEHQEVLCSQLEYFYTKVLPCSHEAKLFIIDASVTRAIRLKSIIEMVSNGKWDINELKSQHSSYVDFIIQDFEAFALRLNALPENGINLTDETRRIFWNRAIYYSFKALVQGYGDGGKCSTEGRALMQLDFQYILLKLEKLCCMKPIPHSPFVDDYIKAYYLPENGLEQWIKNHSEYSSKQLISLLGAAAHVSKKARVRILDALKD